MCGEHTCHNPDQAAVCERCRQTQKILKTTQIELSECSGHGWAELLCGSLTPWPDPKRGVPHAHRVTPKDTPAASPGEDISSLDALGRFQSSSPKSRLPCPSSEGARRERGQKRGVRASSAAGSPGHGPSPGQTSHRRGLIQATPGTSRGGRGVSRGPQSPTSLVRLMRLLPWPSSDT